MSSQWKTPVLAAILALATASAQAYPIAPVPLWELVEDSKLIVVAEVAGISKPKACPAGDMSCIAASTVASLRILETWKGDATGTIGVDFPMGLICPAPPVYIKGRDVVAFLDRQTGKWTTVGLSYGTLYPDDRDELEDLRVMVRQAAALQAKGKVPAKDRLDWLVEAAIRPGTRWHGLYELQPGGDQVHSYYDRERYGQKLRLSPAQKARLAQGFAARPPFDHTLPMTLEILAGYPDPKVDQAAAAAVEGLLGEVRLPFWMEDSLRLTLERFGDRKAAQRVKAVRADDYGLDPEETRSLWRSTQRELGIPKVVPVKIPHGRVAATGPYTPD